MISSLNTVGQALLAAFGLAALLLSLQLVIFVPLTLAYEVWKHRALRRYTAAPFQGRVSIIIPAYNEEKTLRACLESLLGSTYFGFEVIVVDDGSTDGTRRSVEDLVDGDKVRYIWQTNGGKATALNRGAAQATGEIILYTDADSIFLPETIGQMVRWFAGPDIHAVCGNDTPLTVGSPLQKVLAVTTHIGTGFVRRALSVLRVLPIISGNLGAVRKSVFDEIGGFRQIWGEDLEFTFRLHKAGKRIIFDPSPLVRADCPAELGSLWRQRIRWARSYLKASVIHADLFRPTRAIPFSLYLPFNFFAQTLVPIIQIVSIPVLLSAAASGDGVFQWAWSLILFFGLVTFLCIALYSVLLDRDFETLKYIPQSALLIIPLSYFYSFVVLSSVWQEFFRREENWSKIERLSASKAGRRGGMSLVLMGALLAVTVGAVRFSRSNAPLPPPPAEPPLAPTPVSDTLHGDNGQIRDIAIATHFDAWQDWHGAVTSVLQSPVAPRLHTIGISAGRVEWAHFRWHGHESQWSPQQRATSVDMLGEAVNTFQKHGFRTVAMVDFYSPRLVRASPDKAAIRFDGVHSTDEVCFTELVDGDYGRQIVEMVSYLAHDYSLDAISLTELGYHSFCFDDRCLRSYRQNTGRTSWPETRFGTAKDRDNPSVWEWRSAKMEQFLQRVAEAAHSGGKQLIVDVPVSWKDLRRNGKDSGLDYTRVLRHADQIVVWNYYGVERKDPEISSEVVRELTKNFPPQRFFISLGLWRPRGTLDPMSLRKGLEFTFNEGASNIWITPNELMSGAHWAAVNAALGGGNASARAHN